MNKNLRGNLKWRYDLSLEDYNKLLNKQNHRCALCFRTNNPFKYRLGVDHDHVSNRIRGLLCNGCNQLLTHYRDLEYFKRVVKYLEAVDNQVDEMV